MNQAYLILGGNAGDRVHFLTKALEQIAQTCGKVTQLSHIYETAAWGLTDQPDFLNLVIAVDTILSAQALLQAIQAIENTLGRQRSVKWGQRTLDIDILFYNLEMINEPDLQIPHPYMQSRRFVLLPLAEIAPQLVHPVLQQTIAQLLATCPDTSAVTQVQAITEI